MKLGIPRSGDPAAPPGKFQAGLSATVAVPPGLIRELEMECDDQFFRSSSLRPSCARTNVAASLTRCSGPLATSDSGVDSTPSIVSPWTLVTPQITYRLSISADAILACSLSSSFAPA